MDVVFIDGRQLSLEQIEAVARHMAPVELALATRRHMAATRAGIEARIAAGEVI